MPKSSKSSTKKRTQTFDFKQFASAFRREIEEYGMLLNLIYEQQCYLRNYNPISLFQASAKIEAQLPVNHAATANRVAFMQQLAHENNKNTLTINEILQYVPANMKALFKTFTEEVITLRARIKSKMQIQQKLLMETQFVNTAVLQEMVPASREELKNRLLQ